MMPFSVRLTFCTSSAWRSGDMFLWTMPIPPSCASAMASVASVTVSIGAEMSGMLREIRRVSCVRVSAASGVTSLYRGIRRTSSKVIPSWTILSSISGV